MGLTDYWPFNWIKELIFEDEEEKTKIHSEKE